MSLFQRNRQLLPVIIFFLLVAPTASAQTDSLLTFLTDELNREFAQLKKATVPPYYADYLLNDLHYETVSSGLGSLLTSTSDHTRVLKVNMRLGDYQFDNTHHVTRSNGPDFSPHDYLSYGGYTVLPLENKSGPIKYSIWQATESAYRTALEQYRYIKSPTTRPFETDVPDFSKESPSVYYEPDTFDINKSFHKAAWENKTRALSAIFLGNKDLISGDVTMNLLHQRDYFISTEGSSIVQTTTHFYLYVTASIRAVDGDILPLHKTYFGFTEQQLPDEKQIADDIRAMIAKLEQLRTAPVAEPYTGPAILHAQTAGVFFHEIFGHRVEGHRLKEEMDGQTFRAQVNEQVLPSHLSVTFDPTLQVIDNKLLNGYYRYDDEGVKARRVIAVENGILKEFLMSRTPLDQFVRSNGHGRGSPGVKAVSRQSNLIVDAKKSSSMDDLRRMLIKECKRQKKKYGYLFKEVMGGFTNTNRFTPNAFNIFPTEVYRVYVDGRPDELVRGVDLIGTPLTMFAGIEAAGDRREVFNGFCGAESGQVPVSAIAPALFVRRIETQKKPTVMQDNTLLSRPNN